MHQTKIEKEKRKCETKKLREKSSGGASERERKREINARIVKNGDDSDESKYFRFFLMKSFILIGHRFFSSVQLNC